MCSNSVEAKTAFPSSMSTYSRYPSGNVARKHLAEIKSRRAWSERAFVAEFSSNSTPVLVFMFIAPSTDVSFLDVLNPECRLHERDRRFEVERVTRAAQRAHSVDQGPTISERENSGLS